MKYIVLAYYELLKAENTNEVNCETDFHFQAFHQKYTMHERIKHCASPAVVVYLTFCHQVAHFFGDESLYNFYSLHICRCNILPDSRLLLASHSHTHAYLTRKSLKCCSRVNHRLLASCLRVARGSLASGSRDAHMSLMCNSQALITLRLSCTVNVSLITNIRKQEPQDIAQHKPYLKAILCMHASINGLNDILIDNSNKVTLSMEYRKWIITFHKNYSLTSYSISCKHIT